MPANASSPARSGSRFTISIESYGSPVSVIETMLLEAFANGGQPFSRSRYLTRVRAGATLLPPGAEPTYSVENMRQQTTLAAGLGWSVLVKRWRRDGTADVIVTAATAELAAKVLVEATDGAREPAPDRAHTATFGFWHDGGRSGTPRRTARDLAIEDWAEIRSNYTSEAASAIDSLMVLEHDRLDGRLLLLHGPPGTGKTTAIRSLADAWRRWCDFDTIVDAERLFQSASYLLEVALGGMDDGDPARWRMLVLEDCDELIREDAKRSGGQVLSRLLNVSDGLLGQGLHVLICLTTNERLHALHPAIVRPGRCLAEIYVGPLSASEATRWLDGHGSVSRDTTLAELFALRGSLEKVELRQAPTDAGLYL